MDPACGGSKEGLVALGVLLEEGVGGGAEPEASPQRPVFGEGAVEEDADSLGGGA